MQKIFENFKNFQEISKTIFEKKVKNIDIKIPQKIFKKIVGLLS